MKYLFIAIALISLFISFFLALKYDGRWELGERKILTFIGIYLLSFFLAGLFSWLELRP